MGDAYTVTVVPASEDTSNVLAELEVHFTEGPLAGMKLVGFHVREAKNGGTFVTVPSRAFGAGSDRQYFVYVRPTTEDFDAARGARSRVKGWLKGVWRDSKGGE